MSEVEIAALLLLVMLSLLVLLAGALLLVLFLRRPRPRLATPTPMPIRQPRQAGVLYRSLTPSALARSPRHRTPIPLRQPVQDPAGVLIIRSGALQHDSFPLARPMMTLGRSSRCDITLPDPQASRQHARLEWQRDGLYLVDTNSTNGTYVNGRRIGQVRLRGGEQVQISRTLFTVYLY